jgi:hypothetical protein
MKHRTLAALNFSSFSVTPPLTDKFFASVQFGPRDTRDTWNTAGDAWDLAVELVPSHRIRIRDEQSQSSLAFIEFVSKEAPHHELSNGKRFKLYYGFKPIAEVHVINVAGSLVPAGRVRSIKPVESEFLKSSSGQPIIYHAGTEMVLLESLDEKENEWFVEIRIPDETLVGGASYDVIQIALTDTEPVP